MRVATLGRSMVATGVCDLSSGDVANTSTTTFNGNDGDDDPGEPPTHGAVARSARTPSITHPDALEPIVAASSVFPHPPHRHPSAISAAATAVAAAGMFVAEDVALLQDLLLDVPPPPMGHHHATAPAVAPVYAHADALFVATSDPHSQAMKAEPPHRFAAAAATTPVTSDQKSSPSSVDDSQLKSELFDTTRERIGLSAAAAGMSDVAPSASQWLQWDNPHQVLDCAGLPNASALELRRLKNRDSMRRSRQRQRDELDKMRATVAQLEHQYEELCLRTPTGGSEALLTGSASSSSSLHSSSQPPPLRSRDEHAYLEAIGAAKRLGAENLFLKASIQEQASWKLQMHRVVESDACRTQFDTASASASASASATDNANAVDGCIASSASAASGNSGASGATLEREEMRAIYGFTPLSDGDVRSVILDSTRIVQSVQNELLRERVAAATAVAVTHSPRDRLSVFGWDIRRRMAGNEMAFAFVKRFPNASAYDIMKKTWDADLRLERFKRIKSETRRLDILQHANANTYVLGRDVRFPDNSSVFRTVYLRFRMETSAELPTSPSGGVSQPLCKNGYVIGTQSINPAHLTAAPGVRPMLPCVDDHETLVWADMTLWMEFFHVHDAATGRDVCEVRWTGKTDYKSEAQAFRSAADTLLGLLRWEALAIAPVLRIC